MRWPIALLAAASAQVGCLGADSLVCADGRVCPSGTVCHGEPSACATPEAIAACDGKSDGDECTVDDVAGVCESGVCQAVFCGDGEVNGAEQCEGDDLDDARCEDFGAYEASPGLACTDDCTIDTSGCGGSCGDATINGPEECEGPGDEIGHCVDLNFDAGVVECSEVCVETSAGCIDFAWQERAGLSQMEELWTDGNVIVATGFTGIMRLSDGDPSHVWQPFPGPPYDEYPGVVISAMWGASTDDLWLGTSTEPFLHFDGVAWETVSMAGVTNVNGMWGFAGDGDPQEIFAVTGGGKILHFVDGTWSEMDNPLAGAPLEAVWGSSRDDVFAVGDDGVILHYNGSEWSDMGTPLVKDHKDIWGSSGHDVWVVGADVDDLNFPIGHILHYNGDEWTVLPTPRGGGLYGVSGTGPRDVFAVGVGVALHHDGNAWADVSIPDDQPDRPELFDVVAFGRSAIAVGRTVFVGYHWTGAHHAVDDVEDIDEFQPLRVIMLDSANWVVAGLNNSTAGSLHYELGRRTSDVPTPADVDFLFDMVAFAPDDVYAVAVIDFFASLTGVFHYDGDDWTSVAEFPGTPIADIWAAAPGDIYAAGYDGVVLHYTGDTWDPVTVPTSVDLEEIWGSGPDDVYIAGADGTLLHLDASGWSTVELGSSDLTSVWGSGPDDVWVGGADGVLWRFDGASWESMRKVADVQAGAIFQIAGTAPDDVFAMQSGSVWHYDGRTWAPVMFAEPGSGTNLLALDATPTEVVVCDQSFRIHRLHRTRRWSCRASETACADGVDDDCDGLMDELDDDCAP